MGGARSLARGARAVAAASAAGLAWGWYEAGWPRLRVREVRLRGLPAELAGLRVAHLSDFHLGLPSRGSRAVEVGVEWTAARRPDLAVLTGDLLSRPRGEERLRSLLARLPGSFAVYGNHDYAASRDPFSRPSAPDELGGTTLLLDESRTVELRGRRVQVAGVDPRSYLEGRAHPERLVDESADLRILLCHYPYVVERLPVGAFDLVLSGHMHDGQISIPYPGGKLRLAHPRAPFTCGLYLRPAATLHVSPGLGTTFVPFRFAARPEATELVLQPI